MKRFGQIIRVKPEHSKGFSMGQAWIKDRPLFWEAPAENKPDRITRDKTFPEGSCAVGVI